VELLNYEPTKLKHGPRRIQELYDWNGQKEALSSERINQFFEHLKTRKNKITGGGLSVATLRTYQRTINLFSRFLLETKGIQLAVNIKLKSTEMPKRIIFTENEIERLYEATESGLMGMRDRAMLGVYYGCGLRRKEGQALEIKDLLPDRNLVHVRMGKNYQERFVPMVGRVKMDLMDYLINARPALVKNQVHEYFFVTRSGQRLTASGLYERLKLLKKKAGVKKEGSLHSLRHSIATHLFKDGMSLVQIAKFLGHKSLESTQIYTHIYHEKTDTQ
jgi:site-specific recombinase XerD